MCYTYQVKKNLPSDTEMCNDSNPENMPMMTEFVQLTLDLNISSIFYFLQTQKIDFCLHVEFLWGCM